MIWVFPCYLSFGQTDNFFYAEKGVTGWEMMKKDSVGMYVVVPTDESKMVYFSKQKKLYRLLDDKYNIIEQGSVEPVAKETYGRTGQWTSYHSNGRVKATGRYYKDKPVGLWKKYYPSGQLMTLITYAIMEMNETAYYEPMGTYQEYYENGQLKTDGLYKAVFDTAISDAVAIQDPKTGNVTVSSSKGKVPHFIQAGTWYYYKENGEVLRTEEH